MNKNVRISNVYRLFLASYSTTSFSESALVAGTSYQMLEVLALCDREKAQPPSITDNSDNLSGEENKYNEEYYSGVYIF